MEASSWVKLTAKSFIVAILVGAAQVGVGQAYGMFDWSRVVAAEPADDGLWRRMMTWIVFIFAAAVLGGVAAGRNSVHDIIQAITTRRAIARASRTVGLRGTAGRRAIESAKRTALDKAHGGAVVAARVTASLVAAVGTTTVFPMLLNPARHAGLPGNYQRVMLLAAGIGIAVGVVLSLASLVAGPVAASSAVTILWVWAFGAASIGLAISKGLHPDTPRLGMLDASFVIRPNEWWFGPYLMVAIAGVLGVTIAAAARWVGASRLSIALSGVAGPSLVAAGYLTSVGTLYVRDLSAPYVASLVAASVGLFASAASAATQRTVRVAPTAIIPAATTTAYAAPRALPAAPAPSPAPAARVSPARALPAAPGPAASRVMAPPAPLAVPVGPPIPVGPPVPARPPVMPAPPPPVHLAPVARVAPPPPPPPVAPPARVAPARPAPPPAPAALPTVVPLPAVPTPMTPMPAVPMPAVPAPAPATGRAKGGKKARGSAPVPAPTPAALVPARPVAPARPAPVVEEPTVPHTNRPAQVVAVSTTTTPAVTGRAARKQAKEDARARELAERQAQEQARAARKNSGAGRNSSKESKESRRERKEREHVAWVQHLMNLPDDPSLAQRQK